jgi:hypothetical protein
MEENRLLMSKYYDGENIEKLIIEYNIDTLPSGLSSTFKLIKTPEKICMYCKSEMYYLPPSRSAKYKQEYLCKTCFHIKGKYSCECQNCLTQKQEQANKKRILSKSKTKNSRTQESSLIEENTIPVEELSLKERVYLGALLRAVPLNKNNFLTLDRRHRTNFAPTVPYASDIIETLMEKGVLFKVSSDEISIKFAVNIRGVHTNKKILIALMYPEKIETVTEELLEIIRDIQAYESIEYFAVTTPKFNLPSFTQVNIEERFILLFKQMLNGGYSTSQLFNFIYNAIRNTAAKYNCSAENIGVLNQIYIALSNRYDRAVNEDWNIKNYNRIYNQRVSEIFILVSNDLLGNREALFYEPLDI